MTPRSTTNSVMTPRRVSTCLWVLAFCSLAREAPAQGGGGNGVLIDAGIFVVLAGAALFAVCKGSRRV